MPPGLSPMSPANTWHKRYERVKEERDVMMAEEGTVETPDLVRPAALPAVPN